MKDMTCPYCEHDFDVCNDDGHGCDPSTNYEQECPACEKTFVFNVEYNPVYTEWKADCLNGGKHQWKHRPVEWIGQLDRHVCSACSKEDLEGVEASKEGGGEPLFYVQDTRNYVGNAMLWWAKQGRGYTCHIDNVEVWTKAQVDGYDNGRGLPKEKYRAWPKDYIDQRASLHVDMQYVKPGDAYQAKEGGEGA